VQASIAKLSSWRRIGTEAGNAQPIRRLAGASVLAVARDLDRPGTATNKLTEERKSSTKPKLLNGVRKLVDAWLRLTANPRKARIVCADPCEQ
jgi:hypothetical protein